MKFLCLLPFVILTLSDAEALQCMRFLDRLNIQKHLLRSSGVQIRRNDKRLEQDLQAIRNSPQEPLLRKQGFKPEYYLGVDLAREFNKVAEYLREIKADPKRTHIPYFSDQVEKTITDFEKGFREYNQNDPEFLTERLKILEGLKKEAQKRIKDQNVTYDWYANFNLRLVLITKEFDFIQDVKRIIRYDLAAGTRWGVEFEKLPRKIQMIMIANPLIKRIVPFFRIKEKFPQEMMFFPTDEIGIIAFNRLENESHFIGVSGSLVIGDDLRMEPFEFFMHDILHMKAKIDFERELLKKIVERINNLSRKSDREKAELAFFIYREGGNDSDYEQKRFTSGFKEANREMVMKQADRFFDPESLQKLLPESVSVNDRQEVEQFLIESADVFSEILLAIDSN